MINLLYYTTNQPFISRTRNWVEKNDESNGKYDNSSIRFKTSTIKPNLCDYSHGYINSKHGSCRCGSK